MTSQPLVIQRQATGTPLHVLIDDYLDSCRARGLSRATVELVYSYGLKDVFLPWCDDAGIKGPDELTQRVLDRFTGTLLRDGGRRGQLSPHTVHVWVRTVRQFLGWAQREGETSSEAKPQLPKLRRTVVDVLSRDEIARMEAAADSERDRLIVRLLADTGIRVGELCAINLEDLRRHQRGALLKVRGKGGKERLVPVRPELARRIERFVRGRPNDIDTGRLFTSRRRTHELEYEPLTRNAVSLLLRALAYRLGMNKRVHPHLFRHSFATEALRRGMNPVQLANILGHSGLRMIERTYSHLNGDDAYDALLRILDRE